MFEANPHMTGRVANLTLDTENLRVLVPNQLPAHWIEPKTTEQEAPGGLQENREPEVRRAQETMGQKKRRGEGTGWGCC